MGLHFQETMAGTVHTPEGERHFEFSASADSDTMLAFGGWAPLTLSGTASLQGVVAGAAILPGSTLEIGLPLHDYLRYQVSFEDGEGHTYRFFGQKTVKALRFASTMTTLHGHLFRDGVELGPGTLRFDLRELPGFLASWRPWAARQR